MGETLAFASLLAEGIPVRLTGQDTARGTFSQRHAVVLDEQQETATIPLAGFPGAPFSVYNTLLSEYAALAFETGYSLARPDVLVVWEAQFGDFANGAQVVIDQYLAGLQPSGIGRCRRCCFCPTAWRGRGPTTPRRASSGFCSPAPAPTRWLPSPPPRPSSSTCCAATCGCRCAFRWWCSPPRACCAIPRLVSPGEAFTPGGFSPLLDDPQADPAEVKTLLLVSGKVCYELESLLAGPRRATVALARLEQLYPFPLPEIEALLGRYPRLRKVRWVQEEAANQGAADWVSRRWPGKIELVTRPESPVAGTGYPETFRQEQQELLAAALKGLSLAARSKS